MFSSYTWSNSNIGFAKQIGSFFVFFGNRNFTKDHFDKAFPKYEFRLLKQIHSAVVIEAGSTIEVADAHYSKKMNEALVIQTADCMPILMAGPGGVAACHAGWRGLTANIAPLTARALGAVQSVFVGPHIGPQSFEVGLDVASEIAQSAPKDLPENQFILPHKDPSKKYLNLSSLVQAQLEAVISPVPVMEFLEIDTKTNLGFHSYRRDKENAERQYSFIVRTR